MKKRVIFSILLTSLSIAKPISIDYLNLKKRATDIGSKGKAQIIKAGKFAWNHKVGIAIAGLYYYAVYSLGKHIGNKIMNRNNINDNPTFSPTIDKSADSINIPGQCPKDSHIDFISSNFTTNNENTIEIQSQKPAQPQCPKQTLKDLLFEDFTINQNKQNKTIPKLQPSLRDAYKSEQKTDSIKALIARMAKYPSTSNISTSQKNLNDFLLKISLNEIKNRLKVEGKEGMAIQPYSPFSLKDLIKVK